MVKHFISTINSCYMFALACLLDVTSSSWCFFVAFRFIIELCQQIQVKQLDIANFEIFSSNPRDFLVSISDRSTHAFIHNSSVFTFLFLISYYLIQSYLEHKFEAMYTLPATVCRQSLATRWLDSVPSFGFSSQNYKQTLQGLFHSKNQDA